MSGICSEHQTVVPVPGCPRCNMTVCRYCGIDNAKAVHAGTHECWDTAQCEIRMNAKQIEELEARLATAHTQGFNEGLEAAGVALAGVLADVEARIASGKHDDKWPGPEYVRDDVWAWWRGERDALANALRKVRALKRTDGGGR